MTDRHDPADARVVSDKPVRRLWRFLPLAIVLAGLALGYTFGLQDYLRLSFLAEKRDVLRTIVDGHGVFSALIFVCVYIVAVAFSFPAASILTIFGGFLFGWLMGGALVAVGATIGASVLFLATRSAFAGFLRHRVEGPARLLADGFRQDAFGYLLAIRLAPIFPFFVVNIAAALFEISLGRFVAATFLGILPGTFAYAYLGQGVDSVLVAAQAAGREADVSDLVTRDITLSFLALAVVALVPVVAKQVKRRRQRG